MVPEAWKSLTAFCSLASTFIPANGSPALKGHWNIYLHSIPFSLHFVYVDAPLSPWLSINVDCWKIILTAVYPSIPAMSVAGGSQCPPPEGIARFFFFFYPSRHNVRKIGRCPTLTTWRVRTFVHLGRRWTMGGNVPPPGPPTGVVLVGSDL